MKKAIIAIITVALLLTCVLIVNSIISQKTRSAIPDNALTLLKEGNARYIEEKGNHPSKGAERREETAKYGQNPYAVVLSCADSRVPIEMLFDAGVGDIFVVENAGNIGQDDIVAGSIEYAVKHLNVPLLVVLGHTDCGAVQASLSTVPAAGNIRVIQKIIEPAATEAKKNNPTLQGPALLNAAIKNNVRQSTTDLLVRSEIIKKMSNSGKLKIVTGVYNIKTGEIEWGE